jgi:hypothetical protein
MYALLVPIKASSTNALTHYIFEDIWNINAPLGHKMFVWGINFAKDLVALKAHALVSCND